VRLRRRHLPAVQQTLASFKPSKWEINTARFLDATLTGEVSTPAATAPAVKPIELSLEETRLHAGQERTFTFNAPADTAGRAPVLSLRAHLVSPSLDGATGGLIVSINGHELGPDQSINRPVSVTFARGDTQSLYTSNAWTLFYGPSYRAIHEQADSQYYIPPGKVDVSLYSFDVKDFIQPQKNTVTIRFTPPATIQQPMAFKELSVRWLTPQEIAQHRPNIAQAEHKPIVVTAPIPLPPPTQVSLTAGGALQFNAIGKHWVIQSQFSEPDGGWRTLRTEPDRGWIDTSHSTPTQWTARTSRFSLSRQVIALKEGIEIRDKLTNLTDQPQPVLIRHTMPWPLANHARLTLNGRQLPLKRGIAQNAMNPTLLLEQTTGGGLAFAVVDDVFRLHHQAFYLENTAGLTDPALVLAPKSEYEQVWQIYAVPTGDYWDMLNAIRRQWQVNFPIAGPFEFVDPRRGSYQAKMSAAEMGQWLDNHAGGIPTIMMYDPITGAAIHGLQFTELFKGEFQAALKAMADKIHTARPGIPVAHYFHCFLTGRSAAALADPADALLGPDGKQVCYGGGNHHLELRREYRYDFYLPDLNLRRYPIYLAAQTLCEIAKHPSPVDLRDRAEKLKKLVREKLWSEKDKWWFFRDFKGNPHLRYTMQMFKVIGGGGISPDEEKALIGHINEAEFLSEFGMHSMGKQDPAYDQVDIDNGGGGAYTSFPPQIIEKLYKAGYPDTAEDIFRRILWWGERLPYWGDSLVANLMDYRKDTPLQNTIGSVAGAQAIIFGMFGISVEATGSIVVNPQPPVFSKEMALEGAKMRGLSIDVRTFQNGTYEVTAEDKTYRNPVGKSVRIVPRELRPR